MKTSAFRLSPLQREVADALLRDDDPRTDETLAERYGTTPDAIRIERTLAERRLHQDLYRKSRAED
jgi:hypothetical protein